MRPGQYEHFLLPGRMQNAQSPFAQLDRHKWFVRERLELQSLYARCAKSTTLNRGQTDIFICIKKEKSQPDPDYSLD
jgi:hypothetical protein